MDEVAFDMGHEEIIRFWQMDISNSDEGTGTRERGDNLIAHIYRGPISLDAGFLNMNL